MVCERNSDAVATTRPEQDVAAKSTPVYGSIWHEGNNVDVKVVQIETKEQKRREEFVKNMNA